MRLDGCGSRVKREGDKEGRKTDLLTMLNVWHMFRAFRSLVYYVKYIVNTFAQVVVTNICYLPSL
jgi:hypothetical protein